MAIRRLACSLLDRALRWRLAPFPGDEWTASALVVAPHPDDETLGCGGVVCRKLAAGAEVRFVFVTDGAASHPQMDAPTLRRQRVDEAREAVRRLGGGEAHFLDVPDGAARDHLERIRRALAPMLAEWRPETVFVVHRGDPPADHRAVRAGVLAAVRDYGRPVTVYEYPVWYWYHWPWVGLRRDLPGMRRVNLAQTARTGLGLLSLLRLNTLAEVGPATSAKRRALDAHASQTLRPAGRPDWPVLADLGGGDFLARLMASHEAFLRYRING